MLEMAPTFAALGDPTRLAIVSRLADGQARSISQLTEGTSFSRQGVTKHLRVLEGAGLVAASRSGREARFVFAPDKVDEARDYLALISRRWDEAIGRLKAHLGED